jgi:hypothetical protein
MIGPQSQGTLMLVTASIKAYKVFLFQIKGPDGRSMKNGTNAAQNDEIDV